MITESIFVYRLHFWGDDVQHSLWIDQEKFQYRDKPIDNVIDCGK